MFMSASLLENFARSGGRAKSVAFRQSADFRLGKPFLEGEGWMPISPG
ncbi:hypothetical protein MAXJ12_35044 [Mesorhizobium alhagi CCNWXJ12-2]|uniref:Uncharacterized protein n=1 Tax=Mesorhizobium alhagi CCNWXJ12-2 TaxID=1107882 RepID=H0I3E4_9HYPH|nr:hypothetical protein MAXJ12_35044 [Mesorhizobium alhagi CCNWXJ12-2]